jgi:hypothetical protein
MPLQCERVDSFFLGKHQRTQRELYIDGARQDLEYLKLDVPTIHCGIHMTEITRQLGIPILHSELPALLT